MLNRFLFHADCEGILFAQRLIEQRAAGIAAF